MAQAAENLSQNIRDQFLCCKICLDGLKGPKTLPCLHTFCAQCIAYYIDHNRIDSRKFCCPICRRQIYIPKNGVEGFPDSFFVNNLSEIVSHTGEAEKTCRICKFKDNHVPASMLCVECNIELCEVCGDGHHLAKVTEDHTLLPIVHGGRTSHHENYCRIHQGETIKFYCDTCNSPICLPCTFLDHQGHEIKEIKNVRSSVVSDITSLVMQSKDRILQLSHTKADLMEVENELFLRKESTKTDIRRTAQEAIRIINEQESILMNELDTYYDVLSVSRDRQRVDRTICQVERAHDFAAQLMSEDTSPISQLVNSAEAKENLEEALKYELPDVTTTHGEKLKHFAYFLPGNSSFNLGSILRSSGVKSNSVSEFRSILPSCRAMFLHKMYIRDQNSLGDVINLKFLPSGDLAVLTNGVKKVHIIGMVGKVKYEFGEGDELMHPSDLTVTNEGLIAITDCGYLCVKIFDQLGTKKGQFGSSLIFQLPISLTTDDLGHYLVCDQVRQRVTLHRNSGDLLREIQITEIEQPQYISCHQDKVYICDTDNNVITIYKYNDNLEFIVKLTTPENSINTFLDCSGICLDGFGNLLISDIAQGKIHLLNEKGEICSILSSGHQFLRPTCLAVSVDGVLVVSQQGVELLDDSTLTKNKLCAYRLIRADV